MDGSGVLDLGDCPHTVFVLLQLPAERGGSLVYTDLSIEEVRALAEKKSA